MEVIDKRKTNRMKGEVKLTTEELVDELENLRGGQVYVNLDGSLRGLIKLDEFEPYMLVGCDGLFFGNDIEEVKKVDFLNQILIKLSDGEVFQIWRDR